MQKQLTFNFNLKPSIKKYNLDKFQVFYSHLFDVLYKRIFLYKHRELIGYFSKPSALTHPEFFQCKIFRYYSARKQGLNIWNLKLHYFTLNYAYFHSFNCFLFR